MTAYTQAETCDADCMRANNCHGFAECGICRERTCVLNLGDDGLCPDCGDKRDKEMEAYHEHE